MAQAVKTNIVPEGYQKAQLYEGDTMAVVNLREVFIYPQVKFKNKREQAKYNKLVRDVKRTLPYAKMVYDTLIETYEYMETLPNDKARQAHLKRMEKELFAQYKPELKKLSFSQGKLLIKLIDRECNQSSYNLLKAYLGSFRAGFWNFFAGMLLEEIPDHDTGSNRYVQGMLCTVLRYFNTYITVINYILLNAFYFVTHDDSVFLCLV